MTQSLSTGGLSIIIVNYKSSQLILDCLKSAFQFPSSYDFEWIIVDNHSEDNSKELIITTFPQVRWVPLDRNEGFGRANNAGIQIAKYDTYLFLNPDTYLLDDVIYKCYSRFIASEYVACSVQLLHADGSPQITGNNFMLGGINHLLPLPYLGKLLKVIASLFKVKRPSTEAVTGTQPFGWISGAFMMVKKQALQKAGKFDPDFFLYAEEVELCSRLSKIGTIVVYGDLNIVHYQGESFKAVNKHFDKGYTNLFDQKGLQLIVSNQLRIRKQYGVFWFLFNLIMYTIEIPIVFIGGLIESLVLFKNPVVYVQRAFRYTKNILKLWAVSYRIYLNRPYLYKMF